MGGQPDAGDDQQAAAEDGKAEAFVEQDGGLQHGEDRDEIDEGRGARGAEPPDAVGEPGEAERGTADGEEVDARPDPGDGHGGSKNTQHYLRALRHRV